MGRPSSIARQSSEVRALIGRLREGGRTIDEILAKLRELEVGVSRSALARHTKQLDAIGEEIRRSRAVAEAMVERFGDAPESRTARLNIELAHALVMKLLVSEDGTAVRLEPREAMFAATALQKLAQAGKQDVEREAKVVDAFKREVEEKAKAAADAATGEMKRAGLSAETIRRIETEILGISR